MENLVSENQISNIVDEATEKFKRALQESLAGEVSRMQIAASEAQTRESKSQKEEAAIDGRIATKKKTEQDLDRRCAIQRKLLDQKTAELNQVTASIASAHAHLSEMLSVVRQGAADAQKNEAVILRLVGKDAS